MAFTQNYNQIKVGYPITQFHHLHISELVKYFHSFTVVIHDQIALGKLKMIFRGLD